MTTEETSGEQTDSEQQSGLSVQFMVSRIDRYKKSEEGLLLENLRLEKELRVKESDFKDIHQYLTRQMEEKSAKVEELEAENNRLKTSLRDCEEELKESAAKADEENERLRSEISNLKQEFAKRMKSSQEFIEQKAVLEKEIESLRGFLRNSQKEAEEKLADMERNQVREREAWKNEMFKRVSEAKSEMMRLMDNQLELTTKKTILENEQMFNELLYQSRQTEKMIRKNEMLEEDFSELKRQMEIMKEVEKELAERNLAYQRSIEKLVA